MTILNFSHLLTETQRQQVETMTGRKLERVIDISSQIDPQQPLVPQVRVMVDSAGLSSQEWQTLPLLLVPPSLNHIALVLMAELHGHCGYFPACLRLRPVAGSVPPQFEVAEVLDLQAVREAARQKREG